MTLAQVVITGVGVVSPLGLGLEALLDGLAQGLGAAAPIRQLDASTFPTTVAAEVPWMTLDAAWLTAQLGEPARALAMALERHGELRDRKVPLALVAAHQAWQMAQGDDALARPAHACLGLGLEHAWLEDLEPLWDGQTLDWSRQPEPWSDRASVRSQVDLATRRVVELLGLGGPALTNVSACAAGAMALATGAAWIARGHADVVVCGGADAMINPLGLGGMARLGAPSPRPQADACRPFDRRRDGLLMGEGAAIMILERAQRAAARGAKPLAALTGWGITQDGWRTTAPREDGSQAARAITRALERAGLRPEQLDYVNAHGTGTPLNDPAEARALRLALGPQVSASIPVSSIKGAIGHAMAAAGAVEAAACLLPLRRGLAPGTHNLHELDPECPLHVLGPWPTPLDARRVLSTSFGFGGQNVALIFERCP